MAEPVKISQLPTGATPSAADLFVSVQSGTTVKVSQAQMKSGLNLATVATTGDYNDLTNKPTLGTMASQGADNVAVTGGSINNTIIGNTTPNAATFTTLTATGQTSLGGAVDQESLRVLTPALTTYAYAGIQGISGSNVQLRSFTKGATGSFTFTSSGAGFHAFTTNGSTSNEQFRVSHTASAVNYVQVTGGATGAPGLVGVSAQGSDANVSIDLYAKGAGFARLRTGAGIQFQAANVSGAVNYWQAAGAATNTEPVLSVQGSDTNISMAFQSKGTGGISLSTGSQGTSLVNGTSVTALTRTAGGSGYTSPPAVAISAPTTAGGVQATATVTLQLRSVVDITITSGGTGYSVNDVITLSGGTFNTVSTLTVTSVSGGAITGLSITQFGSYTVVPANPVSVTGGTGSGATLTISGWQASGNFTITNAGSGYVEQPTVTFSGGGGSGAAAYATVGSGTTVKTLGSSLSFSTPSSEVLRIVDANPTSQNYLTVESSGAGSVIRTTGASANPVLIFTTRGTGSHQFTTNNSTGNEQFRVSHTASAVNYVQVTGAATGGRPTISAQGSDTNVNLVVASKGSGSISLRTSTSTTQLAVTHVDSAVNYLNATGAVAAAAPVLSAQGTDTNIDLALTPKGTGNVRFGTHTTLGSEVITGYITIKDSGGTLRKLAVIS